MKTSHALGIILVSALLTVGVGALQWTVGSAIGKDLCTHHLSEMSLEQRVACNLFYGVEQVRGPHGGPYRPVPGGPLRATGPCRPYGPLPPLLAP
jgi:hypothetical protein